jgi:arsenite methyltransferase
MSTDANTIHEGVRDYYGRLADGATAEVAVSCACESIDCCPTGAGLYETDLSDLPAEVTNLSLGCGDPVALASLEPGQTVLDLGSGGGIDCFLAARNVGPEGRVIGVDMTPSMVDKARRNQDKLGLDNVEFRLGQIEALPVASDSIDVIISNCVINLSPGKPAVFQEMFRVLRPGGRVAVSDIITQGHFSAQERADMAAWSSCVTGAEDVGDLVAIMRKVGFEQISIRDKDAPEVELSGTMSLDMGKTRVFSGRITAVKPA